MVRPLINDAKEWILQALWSHGKFLSQTGLIQNQSLGSVVGRGNGDELGRVDPSEAMYPVHHLHRLNLHSNSARKADLLLRPLYR